MKRMLLVVLAGCLMISGCISMDKNVAIVHLQAATASMIGLASSDEITISKVVYGEKDALGVQPVTYRATTTKGRTLDCSAKLVDGAMFLADAGVTSLSCVPVRVHR